MSDFDPDYVKQRKNPTLGGQPAVVMPFSVLESIHVVHALRLQKCACILATHMDEGVAGETERFGRTEI